MRFATSVCVAVTLACSGTGVDGNMGAGELAVTATTDRSSVRPGEQLHITVEVTNNSTSRRELRFATGCQTDFEFLDDKGNVVRTSQQVCFQSLTQRTLAAGESFIGQHVWTRGPVDPPQLAAGNYQLQGVLLTMGNAVRSAPVSVSIP
jgi:hypothetical protein